MTEPDGRRTGVDPMEVVSTVSHELRSPLTSIKGFTNLLLNRWERIEDDQKREMLAQIAADADRVTRLLTELLDISRLETGRLELHSRPVDLIALTRSVLTKVALIDPSVEAGVEIPADAAEAWADPDKVEQVLTNLVENALKYADPTGLRITARAGHTTVTVSVRDRGAGIPADDLPRVFEQFFRRETGRPSGTGLGLWISRGLVEAHGGELTAESTPGEGSTFSFTLPRTPPDEPPDAPPDDG